MALRAHEALVIIEWRESDRRHDAPQPRMLNSAVRTAEFNGPRKTRHQPQL